jgi:hypothetical protein
VELDGRQHGVPDRRKQDAEREHFLQSRGIKIKPGPPTNCAAGHDPGQI